MAATRAGKLVVVSITPLPAYTSWQVLSADDCVFLGWRRLHVRHMHGRLVDFLRYHACILGLPDQHSGWRSVTHHQGGKREAEGQGCRLIGEGKRGWDVDII